MSRTTRLPRATLTLADVIVLCVLGWVLLVMSSCVSATHRLQESLNTGYWAERVFEKKCVDVMGPPACVAVYRAVQAHKAALVEADAAMRRGGTFPLELRAAIDAEKLLVLMVRGLP